MTVKDLYPSFQNPYLIRPSRPIPEEMAVIGAGFIGPDIAYSFRLAFPEKKLYLVSRTEESLKRAKQRFEGYAGKGVQKKRLRPELVESVLGNIEYTTDYNRLKNGLSNTTGVTAPKFDRAKVAGVIQRKQQQGESKCRSESHGQPPFTPSITGAAADWI